MKRMRMTEAIKAALEIEDDVGIFWSDGKETDRRCVVLSDGTIQWCVLPDFIDWERSVYCVIPEGTISWTTALERLSEEEAVKVSRGPLKNHMVYPYLVCEYEPALHQTLVPIKQLKAAVFEEERYIDDFDEDVHVTRRR